MESKFSSAITQNTACDIDIPRVDVRSSHAGSTEIFIDRNLLNLLPDISNKHSISAHFLRMIEVIFYKRET